MARICYSEVLILFFKWYKLPPLRVLFWQKLPLEYSLGGILYLNSHDDLRIHLFPFQVLLTLDDDLIYTQRDKIQVF